jgi:LacI family transcriptional regulator
MIIHQIANPFNAEVVSGLSDLLDRNNYLLSVLDSRDEIDRQQRNLEAFIRSSRGGLIWVPAHDTPKETIDMVKAYEIPTITFLREVGHANFDHIGIHNLEAVKNATQYLIDYGHKKIAFLGGWQNSSVRQERVLGYKMSLEANDIAWSAIIDSDENKRSGKEAMENLLTRHPDVSGVICNGDMVALGGCYALQERDIVPGREISIIGFDDVADASFATPSLTTIQSQPYKLGQLLAKTIMDRIENPETPICTVLTDANLVKRLTTGPLIKKN